MLQNNNVCKLCIDTPWFDLPNEFGGQRHHSSRSELEISARDCPLCAMILRAAIENLQPDDDKQSRWRYFHRAMIKKDPSDEDHTAQLLMIVRDLGSHRPAIYQEPGTIVMGESVTGLKFIMDFIQTPSEMGNHPVIAQTIRYTNSMDRQHYQDRVTEPEEKKLGNAPVSVPQPQPTANTMEATQDEGEDVNLQQQLESNLPVWIYGNTWAEYDEETVFDASKSKKCVMGFGARFGTSHRVMDAVNNPSGMVRLRGSFIQVYTDDNSPLAQIIPSRLPDRDASSELSFHRIQTWIHNCKTSHSLCNNMTAALQRTLPARVIDVLCPALSADTVRLCEPKGAVAEYIALSHTWGKSSRLQTLKSNIQSMLTAGISLCDLPRTFQDAVRITRHLGIRYLWIDCLCIIQDDRDDWAQQAATMSSVYRNAYLTISASASSDSTSGCFPIRNRQSYSTPVEQSLGCKLSPENRRNQCTVRYEFNSPLAPPISLHFVEQWLPTSPVSMPQSTTIGSFGIALDPIASEPLSLRGWTLQERVLSARIIHYASDQLYFECECGLWSESGFKLKTAQFSLVNCLRAQMINFKDHGLTARGISHIVGKHVDHQGSLRHQQGWLSLVENYSRRKLTFASDKLHAVAGIARVIAEETGNRYLAGLWAEHLQEDMFWRVQTHEEYFISDENDDNKRKARIGSLIGHASRPVQVRAPSWSWAAIDGPIKFIPLNYSNLVCMLRSCYAVPTGVDEYGSFSEGLLDIEAPVFEVKKSASSESELALHGIPAYIDLDDKRGRVFGTIHLDIPQEGLPEVCYAVFLDPSNAIIVRSAHFDDSSTPPKPKKILCTTDLSSHWRQAPSDHTLVWLAGGRVVQVDRDTFQKIVEAQQGPATLVNEVNHVIRLGIGSFIKSERLADDDVKTQPPPVLKPQESQLSRSDPVDDSKMLSGTMKIDGKDVEVKFKGEDVLQVSHEDSWGAITKDDARVPISIR